MAMGGRMGTPMRMGPMTTPTHISRTATITATITAMTEALLKLSAWLSPAYPVSAYAYSHGLETAVAEGRVTHAAGAKAWVADLLRYGAPRNDAILLAHAYRGEDVADLAEALAGSAERREEMTAQGAAFAQVTADAWGGDPAPAPYPVAIGRAAAAHGAPLEGTLALYLQAFAANLVSAAIRLIPLGQSEGQRALAEISSICLAVAAEAAEAGLDDLGGAAILSDISALRHEVQPVRLFRT